MASAIDCTWKEREVAWCPRGLEALRLGKRLELFRFGFRVWALGGLGGFPKKGETGDLDRDQIPTSDSLEALVPDGL